MISNINRAVLIGEKISKILIEKNRIEITNYNASYHFNNIIEEYDAFYLECKMPDSILGHTLKDNLGTSIMVNESLRGGRKNFTIAHEIGHLILHAEQNNKVETHSTISTNDNDNSPLEVEANSFAAHFLLPDDVLMYQILSNFSLTAITNISGISKKAIYWRIVNFLKDNIGVNHNLALAWAEEYKCTHKNADIGNTMVAYQFGKYNIRNFDMYQEDYSPKEWIPF